MTRLIHMSNRIKTEKKQSSLSSFFGNHTLKPPATKRSVGSRTTPERVLASRSSSFLARKSNNGGFEEIPSSDISFESPEVNNFRNPTLARSLSNMTNNVLGDDDIVDLTQDDPRSSPTSRKSQPILVRSGKSQHASVPVSVSASQGHIKAQGHKPGDILKRSHSSIMDTLTGIPARKVPKRAPTLAATTSSLLDFSSSPVALSEEQKKVIKFVVQDGLNVFYTGSAGTGKSVVLRELVTRLNAKYYPSNVGVTASTGLAACNIGGQTIHRFLGIGLGEATVENLVAGIKKKPAILKRWKTLKVLIVDEVSMLHGNLFNKLNMLGKALRNSPLLPFGGIQIVCTGDFFQLPPVVKYGSGQQSQFCFEVDSWRETIQKTILLTEIFRQKGDNELIDMLNSLRYGKLDPTMIANFSKLTRKVHYSDGLEPTELFPLREDVKRANDLRLHNLPLRPVKYLAMDTTKDAFQLKMLENLMCERELTLKEGAQVMYLKNLDDDIVNGSIGTVKFFVTTSLWDKIEAIYGTEAIKDDDQVIEEIRLLSSKVQAQTSTWDNPKEVAIYDRIPMDRKSRFQQLLNFAMSEKQAELYPVIKFNVPNKEPRVILVQREEFRIDSARVMPGAGGGSAPGDDSRLIRIQLPLLLSWALSIHKAQGQTINRLKIDLKKVFEKGQVYVALSRATCKELLEIMNFDPRKIQVADKVKHFYESLERMK